MTWVYFPKFFWIINNRSLCILHILCTYNRIEQTLCPFEAYWLNMHRTVYVCMAMTIYQKRPAKNIHMHVNNTTKAHPLYYKCWNIFHFFFLFEKRPTSACVERSMLETRNSKMMCIKFWRSLWGRSIPQRRAFYGKTPYSHSKKKYKNKLDRVAYSSCIGKAPNANKFSSFIFTLLRAISMCVFCIYVLYVYICVVKDFAHIVNVSFEFQMLQINICAVFFYFIFLMMWAFLLWFVCECINMLFESFYIAVKDREVSYMYVLYIEYMPQIYIHIFFI